MSFESHYAAARDGWNSTRLVYRAIEDNEEDRATFSQLVANDPAVRALWWSDHFQPQNKADIREMLQEMKKWLLNAFVCLSVDVDVIADGKSSSADGRIKTQVLKPIGVIGFHTQSTEYRHASLSVAIGTSYQNHGYGPEAINWALDWAFKFAGLHRVALYCSSFNERALKVYQRLGFRKEGVVKESIWFNGEWHDDHLYGMLEREWKDLRAAAKRPQIVTF